MPHICLLYFGKQGETILNKFKDELKSVLPANIKPRFVFKGKKLGSFFSNKDKINKEHLSDLVYGYSVEEANKIDYVGETNVRFGSRTYEHSSTDKKSSIYKNANANGISVTQDSFVILERGYSKTIDRKIAEALYVKELKPILNEQVISHKLQLFN